MLCGGGTRGCGRAVDYKIISINHCTVLQDPAAGGGLHKWDLHGGRAVGHGGELYWGRAPQGALPDDARDIRKGNYAGQADIKEYL